MKITVSKATWQKRLMLVSAGAFFGKHLKGFKGSRANIKVELVRYLTNKAQCRARAFQHNSLSYEVHLDSKLKPLAMIRCFAHELIHVSQWLTGKMKDLDGDRDRVQWMQRVYSSRLAYCKHPWEIEAHKYDCIVAQKFIDEWKKNG